MNLRIKNWTDFDLETSQVGAAHPKKSISRCPPFCFQQGSVEQHISRPKSISRYRGTCLLPGGTHTAGANAHLTMLDDCQAASAYPGTSCCVVLLARENMKQSNILLHSSRQFKVYPQMSWSQKAQKRRRFSMHAACCYLRYRLCLPIRGSPRKNIVFHQAVSRLKIWKRTWFLMWYFMQFFAGFVWRERTSSSHDNVKEMILEIV